MGLVPKPIEVDGSYEIDVGWQTMDLGQEKDLQTTRMCTVDISRPRPSMSSWQYTTQVRMLLLLLLLLGTVTRAVVEWESFFVITKEWKTRNRHVRQIALSTTKEGRRSTVLFSLERERERERGGYCFKGKVW